MKTTNENPILPMDDQPAKPMYIKEQHNHNCQQFFGPVTGCVFAMPGANVYQTPSGVEPKASVPENATCNPQLSKENVLQYVMRLHPFHVRKEWQDRYKPLWESILELPEVAERICDKGKQKHEHSFNRDLVGNILCLLKLKEVMTCQANATRMSEVLEGSKESSIRAKLGEMPAKEVAVAVEGLLPEK